MENTDIVTPGTVEVGMPTMPVMDEAPEQPQPTKHGRKPRNPNALRTVAELDALTPSKMSELEKTNLIKAQRGRIQLLTNQVAEMERTAQALNKQAKNAEEAYLAAKANMRELITRLRTVINANSYAIAGILQNGENC